MCSSNLFKKMTHEVVTAYTQSKFLLAAGIKCFPFDFCNVVQNSKHHAINSGYGDVTTCPLLYSFV